MKYKIKTFTSILILCVVSHYSFGQPQDLDLRLEDKNTIGIEFFASTNNSFGGIKKVAEIKYDDPNGGNAFTQDDLQIANFSGTIGDIEFFTMRDAVNVNSMKFEGGGNGLGTALQIQHSNNVSLTLKGNGDMTIGGNLTENSDERLKKEITRVNSVLPQLNNISAYSYKWKAESRGDLAQIGMLAQEVQTEFPELVSEDEEGMLSISYTKFVPILLEAIKEQQSGIGELKSLVEKQSKELSRIKRELSYGQ